MNLFSAEEIARITLGQLLAGNPGSCAAGVTIDSRSVHPGDLFAALPGERHDGHDFAPAAVRQGAAGVLVTQAMEVPAGAFAVQVSDAREALALLAGHHRSRFAIPVVGVTGSVGKTTTKEMVAAVLQQRWKTLKSEGNFNNELGLPLTVFKLDSTYEAAVLEMGMRGAGQIRALARIARPTAGVITNVGETHIEILGSVEAIAAAKAELVEAIPSDGVVALNGDDPLVAGMSNLASGRVILYGRGANGRRNDIGATNVKTLGLEGLRFELVGALSGEIHVPLPGEHNVLNALGAIAVAWGLGLTIEDFRQGLLAYKAAPHRLALVNGAGGQHVIDDTYNANPASMRATLRLLGETPCTGRRVAVLGDMLELGSRASEAHREVGAAAVESGVGVLVAYGPLSGYVAEGARSAGMDPANIHALQDKERVFERVLGQSGPGDVVLVKGSRGMRMEEVVEALVHGSAQPVAGP